MRRSIKYSLYNENETYILVKKLLKLVMNFFNHTNSLEQNSNLIFEHHTSHNYEEINSMCSSTTRESKINN